MSVKQGDKVSFSYRLLLDNGSVVEASEGIGPLVFTVGEGKVLEALEAGVIGMTIGESRSLQIPTDQAFGPRHEERVFPFPKSKAPSNFGVGKIVELYRADGQSVTVKVIDANDESFILDGNHPLAGHDLTFEVTLVAIE